MRNAIIFALLSLLSGCIWLQTGVVRNDLNEIVFVGHPGGAYRKIEPGETADTTFGFCLEVVVGEVPHYYWIPQYPAASSNLPNDAYQGGRWGPAEVKLVVSDEGLFYDSDSSGLLPIARQEERCQGAEHSQY